MLLFEVTIMYWFVTISNPFVYDLSKVPLIQGWIDAEESVSELHHQIAVLPSTYQYGHMKVQRWPNKHFNLKNLKVYEDQEGSMW